MVPSGILVLLGLIILALMGMLRQCLDRIKAQAKYISYLERQLGDSGDAIKFWNGTEWINNERKE